MFFEGEVVRGYKQNTFYSIGFGVALSCPIEKIRGIGVVCFYFLAFQFALVVFALGNVDIVWRNTEHYKNTSIGKNTKFSNNILFLVSHKD